MPAIHPITPSVARDPSIHSSHANAPTVLRTQGLEVTYDNGTRALLPTSLEFAQGEFIVLLGASGAGKSTLLRSLNGLIRPGAGQVIATGTGDLSDPAHLRNHRRKTGMIFQQHHLIGRLSVLANVLTGRLGYHSLLATLAPWSRAEKESALAALDRVGLLDRALDRADQLSGGQQQRVGVARALVQEPRVLLADEPVASLDPATAERLLSLLHGICKSDGLTLIVSLHQVEFAKQFADRIVGLHAGSVVFDGAPAALTPERAQSLYGTQSSSSLKQTPHNVINFQPAGALS
ncbi:MAG TPA: phosphonate ABC transporter ATP-binding protein [Polaromonas sp.]|uniref:phosphonate ABC transporter ATP-binding protein n=1 Tax=Polaromonas sp. TaxID=1869339 RepID=UPI002D6D43C8|nr:phosphonate ABC transporter ATP-binding protein [Polaromonas sp.]HYW56083.1 phosphonate ABC transporter ATP-binding protein [Polaromonas sp.]